VLLAILLWVILVLVALVILVRVLNPVIYRHSRGGIVNYVCMDESSDSSRVVVCLPGILALGSVYFAPLRSVLGRYGSVWAVDYVSKIFKADVVASLVAQRIARSMRNGAFVTIIGSSLGGNLALLVIGDLRRILGDEIVERGVTLQLHDSPLGGQTMKGVPDFFQKLLISLPASPFPNFIINLFLRLMRVPPQDKNIEVAPDIAQLTGEEMSLGEFVAWVKSTAIKGLTGHKFSMWWSQMSWMCRAWDSLPFRALENIPVVYLRCNGARNDTVLQPQAGDKWQSRVPHLQFVEVDSTHCGYIERNQRWVRAIIEASWILGVRASH
jgi:hypothetical protein